MTDLGFFYENGLYVQKDEKLALLYYKKAIAEKNSRAMNNLASFLLKSDANNFYLNENHSNAFKLFEESASLGNTKAITNLGICYLKGIGV